MKIPTKRSDTEITVIVVNGGVRAGRETKTLCKYSS